MTSAAAYLDYNAGAPARPAVVEAVAAALGEPGNPSSVHGFGRAARRRVEDARAAVAALVGAPPERVVFTGGGSEANNLALLQPGPGAVLVSAIEHDSVLRAAPDAQRIPVDGAGRVDLDALDALLEALGDADEGERVLVSVMLANNETGVIQPLAEVARRAHARGALVHCDAVQGAGRLALDRVWETVDLLTLSAHKIGGPQGVGALVLGADVEIETPLIVGGGQERGRRAGTENVAGIVGFGVAAREAAAEIAEQPRLAALRDDLERRLKTIAPDLVVFGAEAERLANTSCLAMPGVASETQVMAFDLEGIAVSAGAACSSGKVGPSHVLRAMGVAEDLAATAIRVSLGVATGADEIDRLVAAWETLRARARRAPAA